VELPLHPLQAAPTPARPKRRRKRRLKVRLQENFSSRKRKVSVEAYNASTNEYFFLQSPRSPTRIWVSVFSIKRLHLWFFSLYPYRGKAARLVGRFFEQDAYETFNEGLIVILAHYLMPTFFVITDMCDFFYMSYRHEIAPTANVKR
jgi:hypothetical protein